MNEFFTILTNVGLARLANATATGTTVTLATIRLGDGGGAAYNPTPDQTNVRREVWRGNITLSRVVPNNPNWIEVEIDVPADVGGFMIREAGLFDSTGAMIAIARYPETFKPQLDSGSAKELKVRMIIQVSNASAVTIQFDPSVVTVSQAQLDETLTDAGFGQNNLMIYGHEPIIINRGGNLSNAGFMMFSNLKVGATYTVTIHDAQYLQGSGTSAVIGTRANSAGPLTQAANIPIVNGSIRRTFTVSNSQLWIHPGSVWNQTLGNTLQIANVSLTLGERKQPFRLSDDFILNNFTDIVNTQVIPRQMGANFVGKIVGSLVENPHVVNQVNNDSILVSPTANIGEISQINYDIIASINPQRFNNTNTTQMNGIPQQRYTFNLIEQLTRYYGMSFWEGATTLTEQVTVARRKVNSLQLVWIGRGETSNGPWVGVRGATSLTTWGTVGVSFHENTIDQIITRNITSQAGLDSAILEDGTYRALAHVEEGQNSPINGAVLSTNTCYLIINDEITISTTDYVDGRLNSSFFEVAMTLQKELSELTNYITEESTEIEKLQAEMKQLKLILIKTFKEASESRSILEGEYEIVNPLPEIEIPEEGDVDEPTEE